MSDNVHKVSFAKHPGAGVSAAVVPAPTAEVAQTAIPAEVAQPAATAVPNNSLPAVQGSSAPVPADFYDGDEEIPETGGDVRTPWLSLIQPTTKDKKIGEVIQPDGTYVLKKSVALSGVTGFRVVPLGFRPKTYVERLPYIQNPGPNDPKPRVARSFEELQALGATDVWKLSNQNVDQRTKMPLYNTPYFEAHIQGLFAIECPTTVPDDMFPFVHEGRAFALALWESKGGSFSSFFIPINTEFKGLFKRKWVSRYVHVTSRQNQKNPAYAAVAKVGEATSESLQQYLLSLKS